MEFHKTETKIGRFLSRIERQTVQNWYQGFFEKGIDKMYEVVDQYTVASVIFDDVIDDAVHVFATVETKSPVSFGQLIVDWSDTLGKSNNINIVLKLKSKLIQKRLELMLL